MAEGSDKVICGLPFRIPVDRQRVLRGIKTLKGDKTEKQKLEIKTVRSLNRNPKKSRRKRNRDRDEGLTNLGAVIRLGEGDDGIRWGFRSKEPSLRERERGVCERVRERMREAVKV